MNWLDPYSDIQYHSRGGSGAVFRARLKDKAEYHALKFVPIYADTHDEVQREFFVTRKLAEKNPHIVKMHQLVRFEPPVDRVIYSLCKTLGVERPQGLNEYLLDMFEEEEEAEEAEAEEETKREHRSAVFVMEWCDRSLADWLDERIKIETSALSSQQNELVRERVWLVNHMMSQLAHAVQHIHQSGWIHFDLKLQNVMLHRDSEEGEWTVRVVDFGSVNECVKRKCYVEPSKVPQSLVKSIEYSGTTLYIPDSLQRASDQTLTTRYHIASDWYAFVVLWLQLLLLTNTSVASREFKALPKSVERVKSILASSLTKQPASLATAYCNTVAEHMTRVIAVVNTPWTKSIDWEHWESDLRNFLETHETVTG